MRHIRIPACIILSIVGWCGAITLHHPAASLAAAVVALGATFAPFAFGDV